MSNKLPPSWNNSTSYRQRDSGNEDSDDVTNGQRSQVGQVWNKGHFSTGPSTGHHHTDKWTALRVSPIPNLLTKFSFRSRGTCVCGLVIYPWSSVLYSWPVGCDLYFRPGTLRASGKAVQLEDLDWTYTSENKDYSNNFLGAIWCTHTHPICKDLQILKFP